MMIDRLVRWLLPRQDIFFTQLEGIAAKMTAAAVVFAELATASGHDQFDAISDRIKSLETEADHLCHEVYEELDRTFVTRSEEHTSELQSHSDLVCRLLLEKKK